MGLFKREKREEAAPGLVQLRESSRHPFSLIDGYIPLHRPEFALYRSIREAVPVVDAAIYKIIRLCGGVTARCGEPGTERRMVHLRWVPGGQMQ